MLTLIFAVVLASAPAQEDARVPALTNAEDCLRANVAAAVGSNASAIDAADFLLSYLCAGPVSIAARYELNIETLATVRSMSDGWPQMPHEARLDDDAEADVDADADADANAEDLTDQFNPFKDIEGVYVDTTSGEFVIPANARAGVMVNALRSQSGMVLQLIGDPKPVFLRELAGRLVLQSQDR